MTTGLALAMPFGALLLGDGCGAARVQCDGMSPKGAGVDRGLIVCARVLSRHNSVDTLHGYVRDAELFKDHAGAGLL